jgi:hypothetical protein
MIASATEHADRIVRRTYDRLANNVIQHLREIPNSAKQSGADSGLFDIWEEICEQVQTEYSIFWDNYLDLVENACWQCCDKLDVALLKMLWLNTEAFIDWDEDEMPFDENDFMEGVSNHLTSRVLELAGEYELPEPESYEYEEDL